MQLSAAPLIYILIFVAVVMLVEGLYLTVFGKSISLNNRVSRRLMLRAGSSVVGIWNEAFDLEGTPAVGATTVPGVQRVLKAGASPQDGLSNGVMP